jgi:hypothetical protein
MRQGRRHAGVAVETPVAVFIYSYWVDIQLLFNLRMCALLYVLDRVSANTPSYGVQAVLPLLSSVVRLSVEALVVEASLDLAVPGPAHLFDNASEDRAACLDRVDSALHAMIRATEASLRLLLMNCRPAVISRMTLPISGQMKRRRCAAQQ